MLGIASLRCDTMSICQRVDVVTSHGLVTFDYVISTPKETSAETIDPALPVVLLLHSAYYGKEILHCTTTSLCVLQGQRLTIALASDQFADPSLRRFNLVAVDLLCYGDTTGLVPDDYDQKMAAADIVRFMVSVRSQRP